MQVGDLIKYNPLRSSGVKSEFDVPTAVVLKINAEGETVQAVDQLGDVRWMVMSGCEVISASR